MLDQFIPVLKTILLYVIKLKMSILFYKEQENKKTDGQSTARFLCQFLECRRYKEIYTEQQGYDYRDNGNVPFGFFFFLYRIFDQRNHIFDGGH